MLEDCLEFLNAGGPGKFLFRTDPGRAVDDRLNQLLNTTTVPGGVALFVAEPDTSSSTLHDYVRDVLADGVDLVVMPYDPATFTLVDDLDRLARLQDVLDSPIGLPTSAAGAGVPESLAASVVPVNSSGQVAAAGQAAAGYRLLPSTLVSNRNQLTDLVARATDPPSMAKLDDYLALGPTPQPGDGRTIDHSPLLGVFHALFGDPPGLSVQELLDSAAPLSLPGLQAAVGGTFAPLGLKDLLGEFSSGRAVAALVHEPPGAPLAGTFWLVKDDSGGLRWADPRLAGQALPAMGRDGAQDPRTAVLERPHAAVVLFGPDRQSYQPELPAAPAWKPYLSVNARTRDDIIVLGPDGRSSPTMAEIMEELADHHGPAIVVNVRGGHPLGRQSRLDPLIALTLHHTLEKNPAIPLVVSSERNHELEWLATEQHLRATVYPTMDGFTQLWNAQGPRSIHHESFSRLTNGGALTRATALAAPLKAPPPQVVADFLAAPTWVDAEASLNEHLIELRTPGAAAILADLQAADVANGERPDRFGNGPIKNHPFYFPNRALGAFRVLIDAELRDLKSPVPAAERPVEPQNAWLTDNIEPHTRPAGATFFLGLLTNRPLDEKRFGASAAPYTRQLLWLREVIQAAISAPHSGFNLKDAFTLVRANGELEAERAARRPNQPETSRAHAAIVEAMGRIAGGDTLSWQDLLKAIDCLTGPDRVAVHFILKNAVMPAFPAVNETWRKMLNFVNTCFAKEGA